MYKKLLHAHEQNDLAVRLPGGSWQMASNTRLNPINLISIGWSVSNQSFACLLKAVTNEQKLQGQWILTLHNHSVTVKVSLNVLIFVNQYYFVRESVVKKREREKVLMTLALVFLCKNHLCTHKDNNGHTHTNALCRRSLWDIANIQLSAVESKLFNLSLHSLAVIIETQLTGLKKVHPLSSH